MNKEITWNIINSLLGGLISFSSSFIATGEITLRGFCIAFVISIGIAAFSFKDYWTSEKPEYCPPKLFSFIKL